MYSLGLVSQTSNIPTPLTDALLQEIHGCRCLYRVRVTCSFSALLLKQGLLLHPVDTVLLKTKPDMCSEFGEFKVIWM